MMDTSLSMRNTDVASMTLDSAFFSTVNSMSLGGNRKPKAKKGLIVGLISAAIVIALIAALSIKKVKEPVEGLVEPPVGVLPEPPLTSELEFLKGIPVHLVHRFLRNFDFFNQNAPVKVSVFPETNSAVLFAKEKDVNRIALENALKKGKGLTITKFDFGLHYRMLQRIALHNLHPSPRSPPPSMYILLDLKDHLKPYRKSYYSQKWVKWFDKTYEDDPETKVKTELVKIGVESFKHEMKQKNTELKTFLFTPKMSKYLKKNPSFDPNMLPRELGGSGAFEANDLTGKIIDIKNLMSSTYPTAEQQPR